MSETFWIVGEVIEEATMKAIVVYESRFGNTARVARAIGAGLEGAGVVRLVEASDPAAFDVTAEDLLIVGGPTEGHGVSPTLRQRLDDLAPGALQGVALATFDTRLNWPGFLSGSAAPGIARTLQAKGAHLVARPESFLVAGAKEPHLVDGETERAGTWAAKIGADIATGRAGALGR